LFATGRSPLSPTFQRLQSVHPLSNLSFWVVAHITLDLSVFVGAAILKVRLDQNLVPQLAIEIFQVATQLVDGRLHLLAEVGQLLP
jgi:hypothetical protein